VKDGSERKSFVSSGIKKWNRKRRRTFRASNNHRKYFSKTYRGKSTVKSQVTGKKASKILSG
jgi:hypothetical protein